MALINCSECGKQVSDKALSCPNCGNPINKTQSTIQPTSNINDEKDVLHCPKCNSSQLSTNKKGFSGGKALTGAVLTGGIGLLAGTLGSSKVIITCLKCGYKYKAGDYWKEKNEFERKRAISKNVKVTRGDEIAISIIIVIVLLILSIVGFFIAKFFFSVNWVFLGLIFSAATLGCLYLVGLHISQTKIKRKP